MSLSQLPPNELIRTGKKGWVFQTLPSDTALTPSVSRVNRLSRPLRGNVSVSSQCLRQYLSISHIDQEAIAVFFFSFCAVFPPPVDVDGVGTQKRNRKKTPTPRSLQPTFFLFFFSSLSLRSSVVSPRPPLSHQDRCNSALVVLYTDTYSLKSSRGSPGALRRSVARACSVRKWHRYAFPKSPRRVPTSQSVSFDYY